MFLKIAGRIKNYKYFLKRGKILISDESEDKTTLFGIVSISKVVIFVL